MSAKKEAITIAIATNSIDKINGVKTSFSRFFRIKETEIKIFHKSVDSGVAEQPFNEETYLGAMNRVKSIMNSKNADFYVSCEAGIEGFLDNYMNVQVVCIFDKKSQRYAFGKSAGWQIPLNDIEIIKNSNIDTYLKNKGIMSSEELLGPEYSRAKCVAQATKFALSTLKFL